MSTVATEPTVMPETTEPRVPVAEQARTVCGLLKEYAEKLSALNAEFLGLSNAPHLRTAPRSAWFLDQAELLRKPLSNILSRGSGLLQHAALDSLSEDELALRMREIEIHLHHMLRLAHELREGLEASRWTETVKKLRVAAGLNAMKGGPLDPD